MSQLVSVDHLRSLKEASASCTCPSARLSHTEISVDSHHFSSPAARAQGAIRARVITIARDKVSHRLQVFIRVTSIK